MDYLLFYVGLWWFWFVLSDVFGGVIMLLIFVLVFFCCFDLFVWIGVVLDVVDFVDIDEILGVVECLCDYVVCLVCEKVLVVVFCYLYSVVLVVDIVVVVGWCILFKIEDESVVCVCLLLLLGCCYYVLMVVVVVDVIGWLCEWLVDMIVIFKLLM